MSRTHGPRAWHIEVDRAACLQCAGCVGLCPALALDMRGLRLECEDLRCTGCELCVRFCPVTALALSCAAEIVARAGRRP